MSSQPQVRLKYLANINPRVRRVPADQLVSFVPMEAVSETGGLDPSQTRRAEQVCTGYTGFEDGDVVVAKITPCFENGKGALAAGLLDGIAYGTTELHVLRPVKVVPRWLFYLTRSHDFLQKGEASMYGAGGQKRVGTDFVRNFQTPTPPLPVQRAIADFLDRKSAAIDALIEKKQKLLELLAEKRTALINRAVTKGLDPDVPMKDSGVPWIGEIPAHWEVVPARWATARIKTGGTPPTTEPSYFEMGDVPWFAPASIDALFTKLKAPKGFLHSSAVKAGKVPMFRQDAVLVVGIGATLGRVAHLHVAGTGNQQLLALEFPSSQFDAEFASYQFKYRQSVFLGLALYTTLPIMNQYDVGGHAVICPPLQEQVATREYIDARIQRQIFVEERLNSQITKLREYRQALITAAVTGQIDVPAAS